MNKSEAEIDATRLKLYEETKHLSNTEHTKLVNEKARKAADEYGFTIYHSVEEARLKKPTKTKPGKDTPWTQQNT